MIKIKSGGRLDASRITQSLVQAVEKKTADFIAERVEFVSRMVCPTHGLPASVNQDADGKWAVKTCCADFKAATQDALRT